jgi:hypothetical protein
MEMGVPVVCAWRGNVKKKRRRGNAVKRTMSIPFFGEVSICKKRIWYKEGPSALGVAKRR